MQKIKQLKEDLGSVSKFNAKESKINMLKKFDEIRSKFCNFVQQLKLFVHLNHSWYPNATIQVGFVGALLSSIVISLFVPLIEKNSWLVYNLDAFLEAFWDTFRDSD